MAGGIPLLGRHRRDEAPEGLPPGFKEPAGEPVSASQPPPLPTTAPTPEHAPTRRRARKGYAALPRAGGIRWKSAAVYAGTVALWWPLMWKLGMPMEWAAAGLAALTTALGGLQVTDTIRPSGLGKAEEG